MTLTELSEELSLLFNDSDTVRLRLEPYLAKGKADTEKEFPGYEFQINAGREKVAVLVRSMERFFAGKEFQNGMQAIDETAEYIAGKAEQFLVRCASRGIAIGENYEAISNMSRQERKDFLQTDEFMAAEYQNFAEIESDFDAKGVLTVRFAEMFTNFTMGVGLVQASGKESTKQIFLAWRNMLGAANAGFFVLGMGVGRARSDRRQFDEIVASSLTSPDPG